MLRSYDGQVFFNIFVEFCPIDHNVIAIDIDVQNDNEEHDYTQTADPVRYIKDQETYRYGYHQNEKIVYDNKIHLLDTVGMFNMSIFM